MPETTLNHNLYQSTRSIPQDVEGSPAFFKGKPPQHENKHPQPLQEAWDPWDKKNLLTPPLS